MEEVARLHRPDSPDPLLETEIELVAKSLSSMALHMLVVVDGLPINLKSYSTAKMYRLIRRGASYYGTYKSFRPFLEQGLNALQVARLALGMNPVAVGLAWAAGKLTTHGAKAIGERVLQRRALQLLNDFVRVIGYEAAMVYGGDFRHRDANWVLGAELVNLEIARGADLAGRDAALKRLCSLALRHEFDRIRLISQLGSHKSVDVVHARPRVVMTPGECERVADELARHCGETRVDFSMGPLAAGASRWRRCSARRWRSASARSKRRGKDCVHVRGADARARRPRRKRSGRGSRRVTASTASLPRRELLARDRAPRDEHGDDAVEGRDGFERVSVQQQQVRTLAGGDRADLLVETEERGVADRRRAEDLARRNPASIQRSISQRLLRPGGFA